jgi:hypothetical protein
LRRGQRSRPALQHELALLLAALALALAVAELADRVGPGEELGPPIADRATNLPEGVVAPAALARGVLLLVGRLAIIELVRKAEVRARVRRVVGRRCR